MPEAIRTQGTLIQSSDAASPEVFATIPKVTSISGPDGSAAEIDVTGLEDSSKKYITGLADNGNISLQLFYDHNRVKHALLKSDFDAGTERNYQIVFDDDASPQTTLSFAATVNALSFDFQTDSAVQANVTLRINGDVTVS